MKNICKMLAEETQIKPGVHVLGKSFDKFLC